MEILNNFYSAISTTIDEMLIRSVPSLEILPNFLPHECLEIYREIINNSPRHNTNLVNLKNHLSTCTLHHFPVHSIINV